MKMEAPEPMGYYESIHKKDIVNLKDLEKHEQTKVTRRKE